jgi:hypothetical protein
MRAGGNATYVVAICLTLTGLVLSQLTAGGQQPKPAPTTPRPTAAWMAAPPNPLKIDFSLDQGSSVTESVSNRGGEITATSSDGTRFILTIPKGALAQTVEITMTPVAGIKNLSLSGGLLAAVQITPENLLLSKTPTLVIRPATSIPPSDQEHFASFAFRNSGQEFHLYPMETDPKRIAFKLLHLGGFGLGRGTDEEQEKIRARLPTDSSDRLMIDMQKLKSILRRRLLAKPAARSVVEEAEWRFVNASFNGANAPPSEGGEMTTQMRRDIINKLREAYQQELMPKLKNVKLECGPNMDSQLREAIEPAQRWLRSVDLFGLTNRITQDDLTSEEVESLIRDRVAAEGLIGRDYQNRIRNFNRGGLVVTETEIRKIERDRLRSDGYNEQEIEDVLKDAESVRSEFRKLYDDLNRLIWDTLRKAYDKAHQCCMQEAKGFFLTMMDSVGRILSLAGQEAAVSMEKRNECLCAIESVSAGKSGAWSGQITHTESFVDERNETLGSGTRQNKYHKKLDYRAVINLVYHRRSLVAGEDGSRIPAQVSASGTVNHSVLTENRWTSASMDKRQGTESQENYSGSVSGEDTDVGVSIRSDGTYSVSFASPCADASGTDVTRTYVEGTGFPEFQKRDDKRNRPINRGVCPTQPGVRLSDGQLLGITGQVDPRDPKTLTGSKTFDVPLDENPKVNKKITITWNLKRCK